MERKNMLSAVVLASLLVVGSGLNAAADAAVVAPSFWARRQADVATAYAYAKDKAAAAVTYVRSNPVRTAVAAVGSALAAGLMRDLYLALTGIAAETSVGRTVLPYAIIAGIAALPIAAKTIAKSIHSAAHAAVVAADAASDSSAASTPDSGSKRVRKQVKRYDPENPSDPAVEARRGKN